MVKIVAPWVAVALVTLGCSGEKPGSGVVSPIRSVDDADSALVARSLSEAEVVFLGRLTSADFGWQPYAGALVPSRAELRFEVIRDLRGHVGERSARVLQLMVWNDTYFEDGGRKGKGIRLSPTFFRRGSEYVVLAKRLRLFPAEKVMYHVLGEPYGIWFGSPTNVSAIEAALAAIGPPPRTRS